MRIVAISDTHGLHRDVSLPSGDVLVHAGDLTQQGGENGIVEFIDWFARQDFTHKIFIAGNHDFWAEQEPARMQVLASEAGVHYLCASGVTLDGINFWGSPHTPKFMDWAFMLSDNHAALNHWQQVPDHTDVLITHGPPRGVMDELDASNRFVDNSQARQRVGCAELIKRVQQLNLRLHVFGHIHEGYGIEQMAHTRFFNASQLNTRYQLVNQPLVFKLEASAVESGSSALVASELEN